MTENRNVSRLHLLLCSCAALVVGCSRVEETGRMQFMLVGSGQEAELGAQAYREVLAGAKLSKDQRMTGMLQRVGKRIAAQADRPDFEWEFALIEDDQVNAFCLPGGKVAVYTGILPIMANEAGMAAVLGHEVAHAVARHGAERMSQNMGAKLVQEVLAQGLQKVSPTTRTAAMTAFGIGTNVGVLLPYSRTHELEADRMGLLYAAQAGYDPQEAVRLWQRMQSASRGKPPEFLSTHPHEEHRITELNKRMPSAMEAYRKAPRRYGTGAEW